MNEEQKEIKYILPRTTAIVQSANYVTLRTGTLHQDEITISMTDSSDDFRQAFDQLLKTREISIAQLQDISNDFETLAALGLIHEASNSTHNKHIILVADSLPSRLRNILEESGHNIVVISDIFTEKSIKRVLENRGPQQDVYENKSFQDLIDTYNNFHLLAPLSDLLSLQVVNRTMKYYDISFTFGTFDNDHIYFAGIRPHYTGCIECLERHIISRFPGNVSQYEQQIVPLTYQNEELSSEDLYLASLLLKEIETLNTYGMSYLTGNVKYFNFRNYESSFEMNRIQGSCPNCATLNNISFKEQYLRSYNLIEELEKNEKSDVVHSK